jgi:predicted nucleic acid-binding protein
VFTLDTNILIDLNRKYPRDVFGSLWSALEGAIDNGRACVCPSVLDELEVGGDALHQWVKTYPGFVCAVTQVDIDIAAQISKKYQDWARDEKNAADPFVVAHAINTKREIVTNEKPAGQNVLSQNQKIPNVAEAYGIKTYELVAWIRQEKWTF